MRKMYSKRDLGRSFAMTVAVMLLASVLLSALFSPAYGPDGLPDWAYWLLQTFYCLAVGAVAVVYPKITKTDFLSATTANVAPKFLHVVWGFLADLFLIAAMLPLNTWVLQLLQNLTGKTYSVTMPLQLVPMIFVACLLPAVTEEFVFRGTIAQSLKTGKSKVGVIVVCGALFALVHANPAQTLHQFVLGAMLTLIAFRSGSVWTAVCVHFFNNLAAVAFTFVIPDETVIEPYYVWLFAVGVAGFAASIFGYIKTTKNSWSATVASEGNGNAIETIDEEKSDMFGKICFVAAVVVMAAVWIANLVA